MLSQDSWVFLQFFSANGQTTILTRDPDFQDVIGTATDLSFRDIEVVNIMYNCAGAFKSDLQERRSFFFYRPSSQQKTLDMLNCRGKLSDGKSVLPFETFSVCSAARCPPLTCPQEGFVGKTCSCWCPSDSGVYRECGPTQPPTRPPSKTPSILIN